MTRFQIEWVGDKSYENTETGNTEYSVAVKTEEGQEIRKGLKLARPTSSPAPAVGETVEGNKAQHPKFDDASLITEDAAGAGPPSSAPVATSDARGDKIDRAVAFKGAVELIAGSSDYKLDVFDDTLNDVARLTDSLLEVLTGATDPKDVPPMDTAESVQADATGTDSDIPF